MREHLYRGKRANGIGWVYGDLTGLNIIHLQPPTEDEWWGIEVIPETVGQFTNMIDSNGVKIWEGDICLDIHGDKREIKYEFGQWSWEYYEDAEDWTVMGNIHETA